MIERKKKIKIIQITLLVIGLLIIFFTYIKNENSLDTKIIISDSQKKIKQQMEGQSDKDIFYNIEYSGLDLAGNRYILKAEEATTDKLNQEQMHLYKYFRLYLIHRYQVFSNFQLDLFLVKNCHLNQLLLILNPKQRINLLIH